MPRARTQSKITDIAADAATDAVSGKADSSTVDEIGQKVEDLEATVEQQKSQIAYLIDERNRFDKNDDALFENDRKLQQRIDNSGR